MMIGATVLLVTLSVLSTPALAGNRVQGVVKWFNAAKGTGFLTTANGDQIFVHKSALSASCNGTLHEGQAVEFEIAPGGTPNPTFKTAKLLRNGMAEEEERPKMSPASDTV
jgi:CspA family cold shock protein